MRSKSNFNSSVGLYEKKNTSTSADYAYICLGDWFFMSVAKIQKILSTILFLLSCIFFRGLVNKFILISFWTWIITYHLLWIKVLKNKIEFLFFYSSEDIVCRVDFFLFCPPFLLAPHFFRGAHIVFEFLSSNSASAHQNPPLGQFLRSYESPTTLSDKSLYLDI